MVRPFAKSEPQASLFIRAFLFFYCLFLSFFCLGEATHTISDKEEKKERKRREVVRKEPLERNAWGSARRAPCEGYLEEVTRGSWWS